MADTATLRTVAGLAHPIGPIGPIRDVAIVNFGSDGFFGESRTTAQSGPHLSALTVNFRAIAALARHLLAGKQH
jgi:hypothetical protein